MKREAVNPKTVLDVTQSATSQAVLSEGSKLLHVAGQVAVTVDGQLVGEGDIGAQAEQALKNLSDILDSVGASPANVVRLRTFIVGLTPENFPPVVGAIAGFFGTTEPSANSVIGVSALAMPGLLIEIEADAIIA